MKTNKTTLCIYSLAVAIATGTTTLAQNIIDQTYGAGAGSFELGVFVDGGGDAVGGGGTNYMGLAPGNTTISGWTVGVTGDGIDWLTTPYFRITDGVRAVDLKHTQNSSISTTIPTVVGQLYSVSFDAAAPIVPSFGSMEHIGAISAGSLVDQSFTVPRTFSEFSAQTFTTFTFLFFATAPQTTITFRAISNISPQSRTYGPAIDKVSVQTKNTSQGTPVTAAIERAVEIVWTTTAGKIYQVQATVSLETPRWVDLGEPVIGDDTEKSIFDKTRDVSKRFYRVIEVQ